MYRVVLKKRAKKFIDALPLNEKRRVVAALEKLPFEGDIKPLKGREERFRLRIGPYRMIYSVEQERLVVLVIDAGNRGEIYRRYR